MKKENIIKIIIVVLIVLSVIGIFIYKNSTNKEMNINKQESQKTEDVNIYSQEEKLPKLIEFGSTTCEPCKIMEPIIASVKEKYKGKVNVEFINVYKDYELTSKYNIRTIPTQIFLDSEGKLIYRHEGVLYENEIIEKLGEMGGK